MMNIYLVHNNWFLGEHLKLDQCDHCQWLNCARGETLGDQVGTQLIIFITVRVIMSMMIIVTVIMMIIIGVIIMVFYW